MNIDDSVFLADSFLNLKDVVGDSYWLGRRHFIMIYATVIDIGLVAY